MAKLTVGEINHYKGRSVNPLTTPDTIYELYSVPSFDKQQPEIIKGADIGSSKNTVEDGDVLICKINPRINRVWVVKRHTDYPLLASSEWIVVRNPEIDSNYLKWYFSSPNFRSLLMSQVAGIGGSLTRAQPKQVAKYPVPIVPIEEQRHIAAVLDKVTDLISQRRAQLDKLDLLVKSRFVEMFGDLTINNKNWHFEPLGALCDVRDGTHDSPQYTDIGYPLLTSKNFTSGNIDFTNCNMISKEDFDKINQRSKVDIGDIIMPMIGTIGSPVIVNTETPFAIKNVALIKFQHAKISNVFIREILCSDYFQTSTMAANRGGTQKFIALGDIRKLPIPVVSSDLQAQFNLFVKQKESVSQIVLKGLDQLEVLKKSLMQQYFE